MTNNKKIFIIDTSVLLYDKHAIHSFPGNILLIPIVVLDELDRFKDKKGLIGENARYVNRYLDDLRSKGSLHDGIEIEEEQVIKVALEGFKDVPGGLDENYADNRIIALALHEKKHHKENNKIILVTKDINFRVKCDALGINSEDYRKDKIDLSDSEAYKGYSDFKLYDTFVIDQFYALEKNKKSESYNLMVEQMTDEVKEIFEDKLGRLPYENEYFCLKSGSSSFLGRYDDKKVERVKQSEKLIDSFVNLGIKAKNREQLYALDALLDPSLPLVSISGLAGSGKTFLTLMASYALIDAGFYERMVFTRNITPVGKEVGFLPGDIDDKMEPWLAPIMDNFRVGLRDNNLSYYQTLKEKGIFEVAPLSFIRGRTFNNTILIMDEAQNATIHELKTVITRMGENSKIILMGDTDQIDAPYIDALSNGLTIVCEKFKNENCAAHISLKRGERSYLSAVAARII
jgi:PhoH-like ATPase